MIKFQAALFDLDGTIIDSAPGIKATFEYTLAKYGVTATPQQLRSFLGPPLSDSFSQLVAPEDVEDCVRIYRERYAQDGSFRCAPYPGIEETLRGLKEAGWTLCLATSKLHEEAVRILTRLGLAQYFDYISGSTADGRLETKADVIRDVLAQPCTAGKRCVMIGDRFHDLEGAAECGLDAVGVLYGYGDRAELEAYSPLALCRTPREVGEFLSQCFERL